MAWRSTQGPGAAPLPAPTAAPTLGEEGGGGQGGQEPGMGLVPGRRLPQVTLQRSCQGSLEVGGRDLPGTLKCPSEPTLRYSASSW